ncbi:hypothetical protein HYR69_06505 [Candidatus Sumerlaeota bacterium]|nr:hypothetical protein [Candidatus Sumerlaeota bacterium]MBI3736702.1 hypothetical protein [Candidatus Sumerlaeota bacterium]
MTKKPDQPAVTGPAAFARVTLKAGFHCASIQEERSGHTHQPANSITLTIPPGATEFVEFVSSTQ